MTQRVKGFLLAITKTEIRERKTQIGESSSDARRVEADRRRQWEVLPDQHLRWTRVCAECHVALLATNTCNT